MEGSSKSCEHKISEITEPYDDSYFIKNDWCHVDVSVRRMLEHQIALGEITINCNENMLIYHGLGSGKSITSIYILETLRQSIVDLERTKFIISCPAPIVNQYIEEFRSAPLTTGRDNTNPYNIKKDDTHKILLLNKKKGRTVDERLLKIKEQELHKRENDVFHERHVEIITHNKLIAKDSLNNFELVNDNYDKIIFIDEIQKFVSESSERYVELSVLIQQLQDSGKLIRLFVLTATPFENYPNDISLILKLLDINDKRIDTTREPFKKKYIENPSLFTNLLKNRVSYFSGGHPNSYPFKRIIVKEHTMTKEQMNKYQGILAEAYITRKNKTYERMLARKINMEDAALINETMPKEFNLLENVCISSVGVEEFDPSIFHITSPKLFFIVQDILRTVNGTIFVYSRKIKNSLDILVRALEHYGFRSYDSKNAIELDGRSYYLWTGTSDKIEADQVRRIFNMPSNIDGSRIKVFIGSSTIAEGITFLNVKTVHLIDTWWTSSSVRQVIARCVRFKSHCEVYDPSLDTIPTVNVYRHISTFDRTRVPIYLNQEEQRLSETQGINKEHHILSYLSFEQYMVYVTTLKNRFITVYDELVKQHALDCRLFKKGNLVRLEERIIPDPLYVYDNNIEQKYLCYYQNPLNSKKYVRYLNYNDNLLDFNSIDISDFRLFDNQTLLYEAQMSKNDNKTLAIIEPFVTLSVGDNLSRSLVLYENIKCAASTKKKEIKEKEFILDSL